MSAPLAPGPDVLARLRELRDRHLGRDPGPDARYYLPGRGYVAAAEAGDEPDRFAICVASPDGQVYAVGDERPFALQSLSKVFAYALALHDLGREALHVRVGVEPTGDAFNSLVFDEAHKRPYNPMVNAGALATTDCVSGADPHEQIERLLDSLCRFAGREDLAVDEATFEGEVAGADRNRGTAYLMRSQGMIEGEVETVLRRYLRQCSVQVTCRDLAVMAATLGNGGVNPVTGVRCLPRERVRDVLSVMFTCGMYDFAGEWGYDVGLPAKSGVSGGIMCVVPGKGGIAVFAPGLDDFGNSIRGVAVCEEISNGLGLHVFATEEEDELLGPMTGVDQRDRGG